MSHNLHHRILYEENLFLTKMCCYSASMMITKFLQLEFNGISQEELIDTKFTDFGEGLVTAFSRYCIASGIVRQGKSLAN